MGESMTKSSSPTVESSGLYSGDDLSQEQALADADHDNRVSQASEPIQSAPELLPCPFCGGTEAEWLVESAGRINCRQCGVSAIKENWNLRADLASQQIAKLEAEKAELKRFFIDPADAITAKIKALRDERDAQVTKALDGFPQSDTADYYNVKRTAADEILEALKKR
jgi:hypothetical protein